MSIYTIGLVCKCQRMVLPVLFVILFLWDHHSTGRGNGDLIRQHDFLHDVLFSAARAAALAPKKESPSLIPGSSSCMVDVFPQC